jgi:hypothetical protein
MDDLQSMVGGCIVQGEPIPDAMVAAHDVPHTSLELHAECAANKLTATPDRRKASQVDWKSTYRGINIEIQNRERPSEKHTSRTYT